MHLESHFFSRIQLVHDKSTSLVKAVGRVGVAEVQKLRGELFVSLHQSEKSPNITAAHERNQGP